MIIKNIQAGLKYIYTQGLMLKTNYLSSRILP